MDNPGLKEHRHYSEGKPLPLGTKIVHHVGTPPPGAVYMTKGDVLQLQHSVIQKYKPRWEVWPFTYGVGIAGTLTAITGAVCNGIFRKRMLLYKYKGFTTLAASCGVPCLCSMFYQASYVMNPILLRDYDCPMCISTRAACGQMAIAGIQTPLISFLSCASVATFGFRYTMPPLNQPIAWLKKAHSITKPYYGLLLLLTLFNGWYAGILAYKQQSRTHLIHDMLLSDEVLVRRELEESKKLREEEE